MYSDLFEHLGGGGGAGGLSRAAAASAAAAAAAAAQEDASLISFKAGKINVTATDHGSYYCQADPTRGEIRLVCVNNDTLEWQWFDRRDRKVIDRQVVTIPPSGGDSTATTKKEEVQEDSKEGDEEVGKQRKKKEGWCWTFDKIDPPLPTRTHKDDRVYVLTRPTATDPPVQYELYWMQDADDSRDEEIVQKVNQYLSNPNEAIVEATGNVGTGRPASSSRSAGAMSSAAAAAAVAAAASTSSSSQVDALSTILENLGMPQSSDSPSPPAAAAAAAAATGGTDGVSGTSNRTLTLADLQGAMAGIQQQQQQQQQQRQAASPMFSLSDVVTSDAIAALLQDESIKQKLISLLPDEQQSDEYLEDNLRSPQVQQTLRLLTQAILPDDAGHIDGFLSVIANFQLPNPEGSAESEILQAASTDPIHAFLDAIVRSIEQEGGTNNNNNDGSYMEGNNSNNNNNNNNNSKEGDDDEEKNDNDDMEQE